MTLAAIYTRISEDRTSTRGGVERQEADCRAVADKLGWEVVRVYCDNDLSAYSGKPRPAYERLLADIESGAVTGVLTWHPDRLHRSPRELERYIDLSEKRAVATQTVQAGVWDLSTPSGRANARMMGTFARFESEHKAERISAARRTNSSKGKYPGGNRPYGYERDGVTVRPDEAAEVLRWTEQLVAGVSLREITRDANRRGLPTSLSAPRWSGKVITEIVTRPRNAGFSVWRGAVVAKAEWPPIVSEELWRAVCALLADPARNTSRGRGPAPRWLGSGIYICAVCGARELRAGKTGARGDERTTYRCARRGDEVGVRHVSFEVRPLDAYVQMLAVGRLSQPDVLESLRPPGDGGEAARALAEEKGALFARLNDSALMFADGTITAAQLSAATERIKSRISAIEKQLANSPGRSPLEGVSADEIEELWPTLPLGVRRAAIDLLMDVVVHPYERKTESTFDRVEIKWKGQR